jgi:UDP-N-acetylglucosamine transferase subunit ALG13
LTIIKRENSWLRQFLNSYPADAIISDNRFGLHAPGIPCIFITHQLQVKTGLGAAFDALARRINYRYIKKFSACWVPDFEGSGSLAGKLSNPDIQPQTSVEYIGALSRFEPCNQANTKTLLIILSGPEPQRSLFESKIVSGLKDYSGDAIIVRGVPGDSQPLQGLPTSVQTFDHLPASKLNELICSAAVVISRCGYTSVMDLLKLQKKCILVPTPGQAEQEYLAKYLCGRQLACTVTQNDFSLSDALRQAELFSFKKMETPMDAYKAHLRQWVQQLRQQE